jgi:hypothetical protein
VVGGVPASREIGADRKDLGREADGAAVGFGAWRAKARLAIGGVKAPVTGFDLPSSRLLEGSPTDGRAVGASGAPNWPADDELTACGFVVGGTIAMPAEAATIASCGDFPFRAAPVISFLGKSSAVPMFGVEGSFVTGPPAFALEWDVPPKSFVNTAEKLAAPEEVASGKSPVAVVNPPGAFGPFAFAEVSADNGGLSPATAFMFSSQRSINGRPLMVANSAPMLLHVEHLP